jgi:hypothetical protein
MGVGSLLFALPHLLADSYSPATGAGRHKTAPLCNMTIACGIEEGVSCCGTKLRVLHRAATAASLIMEKLAQAGPVVIKKMISPCSI